uniref:Malate dehydrogenase n=1 Tax=Ditylenchus dipsaci TaxID=166011 RepID=A0A915E3B9_9BILA
MVLFCAKSVNLCRASALRFVAMRANSGAPKVALVGAAGGIGQPLALLLKSNPLISKLALYDIVGTPGVAADLSHVNTPAQVTGFIGAENLHKALEGADIIVVPAGVPRKPGMTRDDLFNVNAGIVRDVAEQAAKICPKAFLAIITNPVNSTVPIAAEVYKNNGVFDPKRLFGVTTLDIVRSHTFVAELKDLDVSRTEIPVIGGHSGVTIIPLLSQCKPAVKFSESEIKTLTERIQDAGTEVVKAKAGAGSATLRSKAKECVHCAYVKSDVLEGVDYFASPIELGPDGVEKVHGYGTLSEYEKQLVQSAIPELQKNIQKGVKFIKG